MAEMFSDQRETFQLLVRNSLMELCASAPDCTIKHVETELWVLPALSTMGSSHTQPCLWSQGWHKAFLHGSSSGSGTKLVSNQASVVC